MPKKTMKGKDILDEGQNLIAERIWNLEKATAAQEGLPYTKTLKNIKDKVKNKP